MKYVTLLAGCFIFLAASSVQSIAQQQTAALEPGIAPPLKITALTLNAGKNHTDLKSAEWLSQPLVQVENTSENVIEYLVIEVSLPGTTNGPVMLAYGQTQGKKPLLHTGEPLQPGKKINLSVHLNACEAVHSNLLASGIRLPSGSRVSTRINGVVFTNKTAWFDGLLHVADRNDPSRWNVVEKNSESAGLPLPKFMQVTYRVNFTPRLRPAPCWKRLGTQWVDCCGLQVASAVMVQVWGGLFEPFPMSNQCEDGSYCEWIKQVGCSSDPEGGAD